MLDIKQVNDWVLIEDTVLIWWKKVEEKFINLRKARGVDFPKKTNIKKVDYPGEYHFLINDNKDEGVYITCFEWSEKKLNFIIEKLNWKVVAYIQSPEILENEWLEDIDIWLFEDDKIEDTLEKLEYEGEKIKLNF